MSDGHFFNKIFLQDKLLKDCELVYQDKYDNIRLYALKEPEHNRFYAQAVEFYSCPVSENVSDWGNEELQVSTLLSCIVYFDGVRHLNFAEEDEGYLNYPPMNDLISMLQKIKEIESEICSKEFLYG